MKIVQCQEPNTKPKILIEKYPEINSSTELHTSIAKNLINGDIKSKNSILTVFQKSAHLIENNVIKKTAAHLGDANTFFKKTLRSYEDFDFWRKSHLDFNIANSTPKNKDKFKRGSNKIKQTDQIKKTILEEMPVQPEMIHEMDTEDTTAGEDDEDLEEVDDMILKASKELEQVAEENQILLDLLEKPLKRPNNELEENQNGLDNNVIKQLEEAEQKAKDTANKIYELKTRVGELLRKEELSEHETYELDIKNKELKEQMKLFEERTKRIQYLIEKTNIIRHVPDEKTKNEEIFPEKTFCKTNEEIIPKIFACNSTKTIGESVKKGCSCCSENLRKIPSVPTFAKKLSQSYSMQEKLAAENADLESVRFKLQEELLNKDQSLECLQRELGNLQNEMRVLAKENISLNEKLMDIQQNGSKENIKKQNNFMTSKKVQEYSDNTYALEKQLIEMENDVKCLHEEICAVQREREHLEKHRKMMVKSRSCMAPHIVPAFNVPTPMHSSHSHSLNKGVPTKLIQELFDQYEKLESDLKFKINGVLTLKNDYENLKRLTKEAEAYKKTTQEKVKECEKIMNKIKTENEIPTEQEQQILTAKRRLKKAQDTLKEEQQIIKDQRKLVEDITTKFIEAQQQIEEQRRNLDIKFENPGECCLDLGAQIVTNLHDKLEEISI